MHFLEILAVNLINNFNTPLIQKVFEEFSKPVFGNFCPREMLQEKAKDVPLK
jgi:hypothetical protein